MYLDPFTIIYYFQNFGGYKSCWYEICQINRTYIKVIHPSGHKIGLLWFVVSGDTSEPSKPVNYTCHIGMGVQEANIFHLEISKPGRNQPVKRKTSIKVALIMGWFVSRSGVWKTKRFKMRAEAGRPQRTANTVHDQPSQPGKLSSVGASQRPCWMFGVGSKWCIVRLANAEKSCVIAVMHTHTQKKPCFDVKLCTYHCWHVHVA